MHSLCQNVKSLDNLHLVLTDHGPIAVQDANYRSIMQHASNSATLPQAGSLKASDLMGHLRHTKQTKHGTIGKVT